VAAKDWLVLALLVAAQTARTQYPGVASSPVVFSFDERAYAPGASRFHVEDTCVIDPAPLRMGSDRFKGINHFFSVARNKTIQVAPIFVLPLLEAQLSALKPVHDVQTLLQVYSPYDSNRDASENMLSALRHYQETHKPFCVFDTLSTNPLCIDDSSELTDPALEALNAMDKPGSNWHRYSLMRSWCRYGIELTRDVRFLFGEAIVESLRTGLEETGLKIIHDQFGLNPQEKLRVLEALGHLIQKKGGLIDRPFREKIAYVGAAFLEHNTRPSIKVSTTEDASYISFFLWNAVAALSIFATSALFGFGCSLFKSNDKTRRPRTVPRAAVMRNPLPAKQQCIEMRALISRKFPGKKFKLYLENNQLRIQCEDKLIVDVLYRAIFHRKIEGITIRQTKKNLFLSFSRDFACRNFYASFDDVLSETKLGVKVNIMVQELIEADASAASDACHADSEVRAQARQQTEDEELAAERAAERERRRGGKAEAADRRAEAEKARRERAANLGLIYAARRP